MLVPVARWCVLILLSSCAATGPSDVTDPGSIAGSWVLEGPVAAGGRQPTMTVGADGSMHGNGGINRYQGALDLAALAAGQWECGGLSMTEMAGSMVAMEAERRFLSALVGARSARLSQGALELLRDDRVLARFERLSAR